MGSKIIEEIINLLACIWSVAVRACAPFIIRSRIKKNLEEPERYLERYGKSLLHRPVGKIIWLHGASVGESLSLLPVIENILSNNSSAHILVTTTTVSAAQIFTKRMPKRCIHQYIPYDAKAYINNFLKHWQPSAVIFAESELWPNIILSLKAAKIPSFLLNARISHQSFKNWKKFSWIAKYLLNSFSGIYTQSDIFTKCYQQLGGRNASTLGNIKVLSSPLPFDKNELENWKKITKFRPCWIAASTHANEEEEIIKIHYQLKQSIPDIITIIAPRHVDRCANIYNTFKDASLSLFSKPSAYPEIILIDAYAKLGIFYSLCSVAFIGNSLIQKGGGHNPLEPAMLNCLPIWGPNFQNFDDMQEFFKGIPCKNSNTEMLTTSILNYLQNKQLTESYIKKIDDKLSKSRKNIHDTLSQIISQKI